MREQAVRVAFYHPGSPHGGGVLPRMWGCHGRTTPRHGASTAPTLRHGAPRGAGVVDEEREPARLPKGSAQEGQGWGHHLVWPQHPLSGGLGDPCS